MATASTDHAENRGCQTSGDRTFTNRPINRLVQHPAHNAVNVPLTVRIDVLRGTKHDIAPVHRSSIGNDSNERPVVSRG